MLQRALNHVVTVRVEGQLHHAGAEGARDHRRLSIRAAQLKKQNKSNNIKWGKDERLCDQPPDSGVKYKYSRL